MANLEKLWQLEEDFWLKGLEIFESHLGKECLMAFSKPIGIINKEEVMKGMRGAPRWSSLTMNNRRVAEINPNLIVIGYEARAKRGETEYRAICSSTYIFINDDWRLIQHQQTPE